MLLALVASAALFAAAAADMASVPRPTADVAGRGYRKDTPDKPYKPYKPYKPDKPSKPYKQCVGADIDHYSGEVTSTTCGGKHKT